MDIPTFLREPLTLIGRGGYGSVYATPRYPAYAVKISNKSNTCRAWSNEYRKMMSIHHVLERNAIPELSTVRIIKPLGFTEMGDSCAMIMPRIVHPCSHSDTDMTPVIQALFGDEKSYMPTSGRGTFLGLKYLDEYFSTEQMENSVYELGQAMSVLHYIARVNAVDIEVVLGKSSYRSPNYHLYILDFDLSEQITDYDKSAVESMIWSLLAVYYFPFPSVDKQSGRNLFPFFRNGYMCVAKRVGMEDIAELVMEKYAES